VNVLPISMPGEDAVDPVLIAPLHGLPIRPDEIFLAHALFGLQDGDFVIAGVAFHPSPVFQGAFGQNLWRDGIQPVDVAEEMDDVFGTGQQGQVPLDDDAVETVVYKNQEACKKLLEGFHRSPPQTVWLDTKIICPGGRWNQPSRRHSLRSLRLGNTRLSLADLVN
jgi:hypothetical protein